LVVSERVIYTVNGTPTSFSEMMAFPDKAAESIYWLPRYNNVDFDSQLRITNVDATDATVHILMDGTPVTGSPFTVPAGQTLRKVFPSVNLGMVKIESENSIKIVVAERAVYRFKGVPTSYSEIMGLPASQLDDTFWLPWFNSVGMSTYLRFGQP
jgi:hypothetical protein